MELLCFHPVGMRLSLPGHWLLKLYFCRPISSISSVLFHRLHYRIKAISVPLFLDRGSTLEAPQVCVAKIPDGLAEVHHCHLHACLLPRGVGLHLAKGVDGVSSVAWCFLLLLRYAVGHLLLDLEL